MWRWGLWVLFVVNDGDQENAQEVCLDMLSNAHSNRSLLRCNIIRALSLSELDLFGWDNYGYHYRLRPWRLDCVLH